MSPEWTIADRPGFQGKKRDETVAQLNASYGAGNWRFAWLISIQGIARYLTFEEAIHLYEDAYYVYIQAPMRSFLTGPSELALEIVEYSEVYDNDPSNVHSGLDYTKQENSSNHYQDIAVRRILKRLGLWFTGKKKEMLHIRQNSDQRLGASLSPGNVPFHLTEYIHSARMKGWWNKDTIEDFWQSNKVIQVKEGTQLTIV